MYELYGIAWGLSLGGTSFFPVEEKKRYSEAPRPDLLHDDLALDELTQKYRADDIGDNIKKKVSKNNFTYEGSNDKFVFESGEHIKIKKKDFQLINRVLKKKSIVVPKKINLRDFVYEPGQDISLLKEPAIDFIPLGSDLQNPHYISEIQREKNIERQKSSRVQSKPREFVFATDMAVEAIEKDLKQARSTLEIEVVKHKIQFISFHKQKKEFVIWLDSLPNSLQDQMNGLPYESMLVSFLDGFVRDATFVNELINTSDKEDDHPVMIYINPSRLILLPVNSVISDDHNQVLFHLKKDLQRKEILDHLLEKIKLDKSYNVSIKLMESFHEEVFTVLDENFLEPRIQFVQNEMQGSGFVYEPVKKQVHRFLSEHTDELNLSNDQFHEMPGLLSSDSKLSQLTMNTNVDYATEKLLQYIEKLSYNQEVYRIKKVLDITIEELFSEFKSSRDLLETTTNNLSHDGLKPLVQYSYSPQDFQAQKIIEMEIYAPQDLQARKELEIEIYAPQDLQARKELEIEIYAPQDLQARKELEIEIYAPQDLQARKELEIEIYAPQDLRARKELEIEIYAPQDLRARKELEIEIYAPQDLQVKEELYDVMSDFQKFSIKKDFLNKKDLNALDIDGTVRESNVKPSNSDLENLNFGLMSLHQQDESASMIAFQGPSDRGSELEQINNQKSLFEASSFSHPVSHLTAKPKSFSNSELPSLEFLRAQLQTNSLKITQELIKNIDKTLIASLLIQNYKHIASIVVNPPVLNQANGLENLVSAVEKSGSQSQL